MNKTLYDWYENSRDSLTRYELELQGQEPHEVDLEVEEMMRGWKEAINIIEKSYPGVKLWYERKVQLQTSFTSEQINFICEQIGDWYLMMKPLLEGQHNLGHMKERLKIMICGE